MAARYLLACIPCSFLVVYSIIMLTSCPFNYASSQCVVLRATFQSDWPSVLQLWCTLCLGFKLFDDFSLCLFEQEGRCRTSKGWLVGAALYMRLIISSCCRCRIVCRIVRVCHKTELVELNERVSLITCALVSNTSVNFLCRSHTRIIVIGYLQTITSSWRRSASAWCWTYAPVWPVGPFTC